MRRRTLQRHGMTQQSNWHMHAFQYFTLCFFALVRSVTRSGRRCSTDSRCVATALVGNSATLNHSLLMAHSFAQFRSKGSRYSPDFVNLRSLTLTILPVHSWLNCLSHTQLLCCLNVRASLRNDLLEYDNVWECLLFSNWIDPRDIVV